MCGRSILVFEVCGRSILVLLEFTSTATPPFEVTLSSKLDADVGLLFHLTLIWPTGATAL